MMKPLLLVLILAGGLRFASLTFDSLWLDESYQTVVEAYGNGLPDLFNATGETFLFKPGEVANYSSLLANFRQVDPLCPPLYAILINRWLTIFGGSDFALRAFSVLCSLLSIASVYFWGCALLTKRCGLYAALLQAISPFDIHYAQEARMYSLVALSASLAGGSLLYLCLRYSHMQSKASRRFLFAFIYTISTWALVNTHYTQLFTWCAFVILAGLVFFIVRADMPLLAYVAASNLCIIVLSIPWFSFFSQAATLQTASFYIIRHSNLLWPFWALLIRIPFNWLVFLAGKKVMLWAVPVYVTSACLIAYPLLAISRAAGKKSWQALTRRLSDTAVDHQYIVLYMLILWSLLPAILIWLFDVLETHKVIEVPRYVMGTMPAIFLIAGYSLYRMENKKFFLPLLMAHSIFCFANNAYMHIVPQRENWRVVAQTIERVCQLQTPILVSPYYNIVCLDRYLHYPLRQIGVSSVLGAVRLESIIDNMSNSNKSNGKSEQAFWVLSAQEGDTIFDIVPRRCKIVQKYDFPHALHLRQYIFVRDNSEAQRPEGI